MVSRRRAESKGSSIAVLLTREISASIKHMGKMHRAKCISRGKMHQPELRDFFSQPLSQNSPD
jgi:hypothetical protein